MWAKRLPKGVIRGRQAQDIHRRPSVPLRDCKSRARWDLAELGGAFCPFFEGVLNSPSLFDTNYGFGRIDDSCPDGACAVAVDLGRSSQLPSDESDKSGYTLLQMIVQRRAAGNRGNTNRVGPTSLVGKRAHTGIAIMHISRAKTAG